MLTTRTFICLFGLFIVAGLPCCRVPEQMAVSNAKVPTANALRAGADRDPPGELNVEQVMTLLEVELGVFVYHEGSSSLGFKDGEWREIAVFRIDGEDYCHATRPEEEWADCDAYVAGSGATPPSSLEYLGLAVLAYTDPAAPRVERLRMLERSCQAWDNYTCAEPPGTGSATSRGASDRTAIHVERLAVSDIDWDMEAEIELVTTYVELGTDLDGDFDHDPTLEIFTRRRLTVLRGDLSRQLDVDIHQEMSEWAPGVYADNDVINASYQFTPDGAALSWCEMEFHVAFGARECPGQVCTSPTARVLFPYDTDKDIYTNAAPEALRPVVDDWDGCRKP